MAKQIPTWLKPGIWGAVLGGAALAFVGFTAEWVVTAKVAQRTADQQSTKAVVAALTPICVAQFRTSPQTERTTHLAALEKESYWQRGDYVEEQGWATMPGTKEVNDDVAEACAKELLKTAETKADKTSG